MKNIKSFDDFTRNHNIPVNESGLGFAIASSMMNAKHKNSNSSSRYDDDDDNHSTGARIINGVIKTAMFGGGLVLAGLSTPVTVIAGVIIAILGLNLNLKEVIDDKIIKESVDCEYLTEGKIKDFFLKSVAKLALKNNKFKKMCEEIKETEAYKKAVEKKSLEELTNAVVDYFKSNKNKEKECEELSKEFKK
jgi:hypothetical protein